MIGVSSNTGDIESITEFFELFKTPWEILSPDKKYSVVVSAGSENLNIDTELHIIFGAPKNNSVISAQRYHKPTKKGLLLESNGKLFPVYAGVYSFSHHFERIVTLEETGESIGIKINCKNKKVIRIGFDLFKEIKYLLSSGQPAAFSNFPTLDIHIDNFRYWIIESNIPLIEIPPIPAGKKFFICLTHDVDFYEIRNHKFDHTLFGFLYRATFISFYEFLIKKIRIKKFYQNILCVFSLPFIFFGIYKDIWKKFNQYIEIEKQLSSTFFIVPFRNKSGKKASGSAPNRRSVKYDIENLKEEIKLLNSHNFEIGVHGIDSWIDSNAGKVEYEKVSNMTGHNKLGIRMHWLYFAKESPKNIEEAGFLYDSTFGYNETVGYKGGTLQVFRFPGTNRLLEVPLHIQDTALFFPKYMSLAEKDALQIIKKLINDAETFGGVLTLNWHLRSIAPERLWDDFYLKILNEIQLKKVKFLTAGLIAEWFNNRRSVSFDKVLFHENGIKIKISGINRAKNNGLCLRVHKPQPKLNRDKFKKTESNYWDVALDRSDEIDVIF